MDHRSRVRSRCPHPRCPRFDPSYRAYNANMQHVFSLYRPLLPLMKENVLLNFPTTASPPVHVSELDWGTTPPSSLSSNPDIILAADCVYFEPAFPLLVETLCGLCPIGEDREVLFCWKKRRKVSSRLGLGHRLKYARVSELTSSDSFHIVSNLATHITGRHALLQDAQEALLVVSR